MKKNLLFLSLSMMILISSTAFAHPNMMNGNRNFDNHNRPQQQNFMPQRMEPRMNHRGGCMQPYAGVNLRLGNLFINVGI